MRSREDTYRHRRRHQMQVQSQTNSRRKGKYRDMFTYVWLDCLVHMISHTTKHRLAKPPVPPAQSTARRSLTKAIDETVNGDAAIFVSVKPVSTAFKRSRVFQFAIISMAVYLKAPPCCERSSGQSGSARRRAL